MFGRLKGTLATLFGVACVAGAASAPNAVPVDDAIVFRSAVEYLTTEHFERFGHRIDSRPVDHEVWLPDETHFARVTDSIVDRRIGVLADAGIESASAFPRPKCTGFLIPPPARDHTECPAVGDQYVHLLISMPRPSGICNAGPH